MFDKYLVTGGNTPIGKSVVQALIDQGKSVRVLVMPDTPEEFYDDKPVEVFEGTIFDKDSMRDFFKVEDSRNSVLLHVDELCNFSGEKNLNMRRVNVAGTINVVEQVLKYKTGKMVYLSSAYALQDAGSENPTIHFDRTKVEGDYAQTKAEASAFVMEKIALNKLNCTLLLPTFIIGPYITEDSEIGRIFNKYIDKGVSPIKGGHSFVDIRDVVIALVALAENGERGAGYIISGEYKSADEFFTELSDAKGVDKVKPAAKIVSSEKMAKLVDTYYKITRKENPKEAYALFRNNPDARFTSTISEILPDSEKFTVKESITDSFTSDPVRVSKSPIAAPAPVAPVEEPSQEEAMEAPAEEVVPEVVEAVEAVEAAVAEPVEVPEVAETIEPAVDELPNETIE